MRASLVILLATVSAAAFLACATGSEAFVEDDDGGSSTGDSGHTLFAPPDSGVATDSSTPKKDSGTTPPKDSGTTPPKDSGTTTVSGDCVGTQSAYAGESYDYVCDDDYFAGVEADCTPGGNDCAAYNTASITFCCYKPPPTGYCYEDYFGAAQCVPK